MAYVIRDCISECVTRCDVTVVVDVSMVGR